MNAKTFIPLFVALAAILAACAPGSLVGGDSTQPPAAGPNLEISGDGAESENEVVLEPPRWTANCANLSAPPNGQVFWSNHRNGSQDPFAVVYDPNQGGSPDHPALGWYYQPCLPSGPERVSHELALVLQPGTYRFTGPECRVWLNFDQNHPWEQGTLIIDRENLLAIEISATSGTNPAESWLAVKCAQSWASGFSFEFLGPLP